MYRLHFPIKGLAVYMLINFSIIAINYTTCLRSIKIFVSAVTMPRTLLSTVSVGHQTYDEKTRFLCKYKKMIILYITLCTFNFHFVNKKHNKNQASKYTMKTDQWSPLELKGCFSHFVRCQKHPLNSKVTKVKTI